MFCLVCFQRFTENSNVGTCYNELLQIEHGEFLSRLKLRTCNALFNALDCVSDSVEISNEDHEIQVSQSNRNKIPRRSKMLTDSLLPVNVRIKKMLKDSLRLMNVRIKKMLKDSLCLVNVRIKKM